MSPEDLQRRLTGLRNADGGWPYYAGNQSRIEPTAWALLALAAVGAAEQVSDGVLAFLTGLRRENGLLTDPGAPAANAGWNGAILLALQSIGGGGSLTGELQAALAQLKGIALPPDSTIRQDNGLQAWPWGQGTFSWVEPTAYCTLALKRSAGVPRDPPVSARLDEAERMLIDRACRPAGWNYGNSAVLGQDLHPYVPTTALALLALQDRREEPVVRGGLDWLSTHATSEPATMALGLAAACLTVFGRPADNTVETLMELGQRTGHLNNAHLLAIALFATTVARHGATLLRLG